MLHGPLWMGGPAPPEVTRAPLLASKEASGTDNIVKGLWHQWKQIYAQLLSTFSLFSFEFLEFVSIHSLFLFVFL